MATRQQDAINGSDSTAFFGSVSRFTLTKRNYPNPDKTAVRSSTIPAMLPHLPLRRGTQTVSGFEGP
ncbi:hypothetical protein AJ80_09585 [Polytolypa hystricis UAMH7299]|uniref:Uncharacterized protein n=1 Tax=Polytolypa hystricis (strain UAMH7299) TaxID=1447883 RepID=A0A2B7WFD8_POLH7|nr:hypothetical protein AJ80_09585 [Polytolypa hystricis UAMH7299]